MNSSVYPDFLTTFQYDWHMTKESSVITIHLGRLDLGNNHTSDHLFRAIAENLDKWGKLEEDLGPLRMSDQVNLYYEGNFSFKYFDTWVVQDVVDFMKHYKPED